MPNYKPIPKLTPETIARFWSKVARGANNECWPWLAGCVNKHGYGAFCIKHKNYYAHRVALAIVGIRDNNLEVAHDPILCNNPKCVNPLHLRFATHQENVNDQKISGTYSLGIYSLGSKHANAKLTETDVPIIRKLSETMLQREIGKLFNVHLGRISAILRNKNWTHVVGVATDEEVEQFFKIFPKWKFSFRF